MKTPQITPEWKTGIYIGNGRIAHKPMSHTLANYTDDDLLGVIMSPHTSSEQKYAVLAERTKRNFKAKAND